jgi:GNAT superfamily N-acetyltransferase
MTVADIDAAAYIRKAALEALGRSNGQEPPPWNPYRYPHFEHLLRTDAGGAWVAEVDGTASGFSMGFVRGHIFFLAQLFVLPELHSLGLGGRVLQHALDYGRGAGATIFSVVSSTSQVAQALYMRNGMFATGILYRLTGPVETLTALPGADANTKVVVDCHGWQDKIAELDREVWGAERREDHALYLSGGFNSEAFALTRGSELVGYGYCADTGFIGPIAARRPEDQLALLRIAGEKLAAMGVTEVFGSFLSHNPTVAGALLRGGWKTSWWTFFKTSEAYGRFDRYVPSGGLLL